MFLHFHLSRIIKDIEKMREQTPKKEPIPKKWFSNITSNDIDNIAQDYLNYFF